MTESSAGKTIFLSYTRADREVAAEVVTGFHAAGADVWWDEGGIGWGDNWISKLEAELSRCTGYIVLVGQRGVNRWVKAELSIALRLHFEADLPIFPLLLPGMAPESLPPFLSIFQARELPDRPTLDDFRQLAEAIVVAKVDTQGATFDESICPFPGLEPYDEKNARFFFGRRSEALDLVRRLGLGLDGVYRRWLQVEGPSGVGKSSLVRAGLIPAVKLGWLEEGIRSTGAWSIVFMRPGNDPVGTLAAELERTLLREEAPASLYKQLQDLRQDRRRNPTSLRHLLRVGAKGTRLLLIVDQFEELFTLTEDQETRLRFDALLAEALKDLDGPLHLVTSVRSDFMQRFAELPLLHGLLNEMAGRYNVQPIGEAGLREVMLIPARRAGMHWSEESLPDRIVEDALAAGAGALPLVANLLRLLWDKSQQRGKRMLAAGDYAAFGGVGGALANSADELLDSLGSAGKERARKLLLALVKVGKAHEATKHAISKAMALKVAGGGEEAEHILNRVSGLRDHTKPHWSGATPRLVVVRESGEGIDYTVDLVHETLLRVNHHGDPYWRTLRDWVEQYRGELEEVEFVQTAATRWKSQLDSPSQWSDEEAMSTAQTFERLGFPLSETVRRFLGPTSLDEMLTVLDDASTSPELRATIGIRLNLLGHPPTDPRRGVGLRDGIPAIDWIPITEGQIELKGANGQFKVEVFDIARLPITRAQYRSFTEDPKGYNNTDWWRGLVHIEEPGEQNHGLDSSPAENVSWYDAVAFCRWFTTRLRERNLLSDNKIVRLPTEWEWQQAATGGHSNNIYPWGLDWKANMANTQESAIGRTIVVGLYPEGAWAGGPLDMIGNVWEWCQNRYENPHQTATDMSGELRVVRGGSWKYTQANARTDYRDAAPPDDRNLAYGFRICCASISQTVT